MISTGLSEMPRPLRAVVLGKLACVAADRVRLLPQGDFFAAFATAAKRKMPLLI